MTSSLRAPDATLIKAIQAIVGEAGWKPGQEAQEAQRYFEDPRGRFQGGGCLIALPESTEQVAEILRLCDKAKAGVIPYGGGTGVVAGQLSIARDDAIILSLERMNRVRQFSVEERVLTAESGCILENLHSYAFEAGLMFPLSMASKGSCSIGGNLATNAGGIQVLRHGNARDLCLGIEAVFANGDVFSELSPLRKNNTGYDLRHLLIGSEGTLGVITAASLVLKPLDPETVTVFCAMTSPGKALRLYNRLDKVLGDSISGLELMSDFGLDLVTTHFPALAKPFRDRYPWYLLVEVGGHLGIRARVEDVLSESMELEILQDAVFADSQAQRAALWDLREYTPEANRLTGAICSSDTSVPIGQIEPFIARAAQAVAKQHPGLRINSYGHMGDGNIHLNVFPPAGFSKADFLAGNGAIIDAVRMAINETTHHFGGSISAEHGIGRLKTSDLKTYAGHAKLKAMTAVKKALDPNGILNPGALIG
ncbi:MAG: FAD-binding oxidoreductase [Pseudomonadota bacterium]